MALQRIDPMQINGGTAPVGNVLGKTTDTTVGFFEQGQHNGSQLSPKLEYDAESGTLTYIDGTGQQATASGFPTANQLKVGKEGAQGKQGVKGTNGKDGRDGRDGKQGCPGPRGYQGRQGPTGNTGPIGNTGDRGAPGPTGATGNTGAPGRDAIKDTYIVTPLVDPVTNTIITGAYIGSNTDPNTGFKHNFGRIKSPSSNSSVSVVFNTPFINRCVALNITFLNNITNQAKTFRLYNLDSSAINENLMLGGFLIKADGLNSQQWDFFYSALGD